jgi:hypothetical protein
MAWIELLGRRGKKAKHYFDADTNQYRAVLTIHDQHYTDELDQWQDVDENIVDDGDGFDKKCEKTRHIFRIGTGGNRRWYPRRNVTTEYVDITGMQYWDNSWRNLNLPAAAWKAQGAEWDMTDLYASITNTWKCIKADFILKNSSAYTRLRFEITFTGLTYNDATGELTSTTDGLVWGYISKPVAKDANGVEVIVTQIYDGTTIEWSVDTTGATFPVSIDPTFTDGGGGGDVNTDWDTYVNIDAPDDNFGTSQTLYHSLSGPVSNSLFLFNLDPLEGMTVTSATLWVTSTAYHEYGNTLAFNRILSANPAFIEGTATWNYRATASRWAGDVENNGGPNAGCSVSGTDFASTAMGVLGTDEEPEDTPYEVPLGLTEFNNMRANNSGIVGRSTYGSFHCASSDDTYSEYRPVLDVIYDDPGITIPLDTA